MPDGATPRYGLRRFVVGVLTAFILVVVVGVPTAIVAPVPAAVAIPVAAARTTTAKASVVFPDFGSAAVGAVGMTGTLATAGSQKPRSIASITKVVTALVVLDRKPIVPGEDGPTITFTDKDVRYLSEVLAKDGSWQEVQAGWRTTERNAIETMLIPSANNYAESLAVWAFGSVPKYLVAARAYLKQHGLDDTTVVDSNGLDAGDRSTPTDLVDLGRLALAEPTIAATVRQPTADEPNVGDIENTNELLGTYGIDGIKTGTTEDAGACLLFSADLHIGGRTVQAVGVILGASTHPVLDEHVVPLLKSVKRGMHDVELATKQEAFATYRTRWGGTAKAVAAASRSRLVWSAAVVDRVATVKDITGGRKGERVGTAVFHVQGKVVRVPLVLDRDVLAAPVWWRLTHPLR